MLASLDINKILFLDIETVPLYAKFDEVPEIEKYILKRKQPTKERNRSQQRISMTELGYGLNLGKSFVSPLAILFLKTHQENFV